MAVMWFVLDSQDNVLLLHRKVPDVWEPVKWSSEDGETYQQWILREFQEETGLQQSDIATIKVMDPKYQETLVFHQRQIDVVGVLFLIKLKSTKPTIHINYDIFGWEDHDDYQRVTLPELINLPIYTPYANHHKTNIKDFL